MNGCRLAVVALLLAGGFLREPLLGEDHKSRATGQPAKTLGSPNRAKVNINRISSGFYDDGSSDRDVVDKSSPGMYYPKGDGRSAVYASGVMWGALCGESRDLRIGGCGYNSGLQAGKILSPTEREDPNLSKNRVYRVRPDIPPDNWSSDIRPELDDGEGTSDEVYERYHKDWQEWPWFDGAPFVDNNGDGVYDPSVDIPGVPRADQTLWYVANDMVDSPPPSPYFQPMRIEIQQTVWAYASETALGNMIFRRSVLINKGTEILDSMFLSLFVDPDVGDSNDDPVGCDTARSLAFVYNSKERDLGYQPLPPPAVGFDFLQGPIVDGLPTDSALFLGQRVYGKRNLPMTASYVFSLGEGYLNDPPGGVTGVPQWYNYMRGLVGSTGEPYIDPSGVPTAFPYAGDPEKHTGWLDEIPYDKRFGLCSGPFTMVPGDTQEIVIAEIAAGAVQGIDRLSAIGLLKFYDDQGQSAYNSFFNFPTAPPAPKVTASALDKEIVLTWGDDPADVNATESSDTFGYRFQGYNVYQLPFASADVSQAKRLATYDVIDGVSKISDKYFDAASGTVESKVKQFGSDSGIKRSIQITTDFFNSDLPLVNYNKYFFAVTAYSYNPDPAATPATLENQIAILTMIPQGESPGSRLAGSAGDTITPVTQTTLPGAVSSTGSVLPLILDPARSTGHPYQVSIDTTAGQKTWNLRDIALNKILLSGQSNFSDDDDYLIVDGMLVKVIDIPDGWKDWQIASGERHWTWESANWGMEGFNGAIGNANDNWFSGGVGHGDLRSVLIKFAATDTNGVPVDANEPDLSYGYRYLRSAASPPAQPEFAPFIVNPTGGYAYQDYTRSLPLAVYNVDTSPPVRLMVGYLENNASGGRVDGKYWPEVYTDADNTVATGPREWFFVFYVPYSETPDPALQVDILSGATPMMWFGTPARRDRAGFGAEDEFLILCNHSLTTANSFTFTSPSNVTRDEELAKNDVNQINVFPNPYYGVNPQETDKYLRFVTFTHLPDHAIIRIFNLAGVMVRKIDRMSPSQFEQWDLKNQEGLPVGSGLYIAHVDMPDLGVTKILKIAVVQEQQILDRY